MSYDKAKQELAMLMHNGQISEYQYQQELASLKYAYAEAQSHRNDQQGVSA